jgi:hypothetical protein
MGDGEEYLMSKWWLDYPWRMIQTNLRQIDMKDIDANQFVRDLKSFEATVVLFNAAGIIANYETGLAYETVNEFLTGGSLAHIIDACHEADIRIIARTDFSKVRQAVYEAHPDWAFRNIQGGIINYNGDVHVCPNGPYQQEYMFHIITDMFARFPFDGIFYNMGGFKTRDYSYNYHGLCHCESCKKKFSEQYDLELPSREDPDNPVYQKYQVFVDESLKGLNRRLMEHVRSIGQHIAIDGYDFQRIESNTELGRPLPVWQYSASSNTRNCFDFEKSIKPSNTSVDFLGFPCRHVAVSPWLQELRLWQDLANLGGIDYYLIGRLDNHGDKSGFSHVRKVFHFAAENYGELKGLESRAEALLFHKTLWDDDPEARGWIRVFNESHIPLDERQLEKLSRLEQLRPYKLIVLPDLRFVSDAHIAIFDEYAKQGGTVLLSGETALFNGRYEPRNAMPLQCAGIKHILYHRKDMVSAMFRVDSPEDKRVFAGFDNASYIGAGYEYIFVEPCEEAQSWLRLVPPQPFGPPERCYAASESDVPGLYRFRYGEGQGIYIPWKPGTFFYKEGYPNTAWFMRDVLEKLCGMKSLAPALSPMVELTFASRPDRIVVQLVNISGHYGNSYFEPLPIHDIGLQIPCLAPVTSARTLWSKETPRFNQANGFVELTLPCLKEYEAVVLEIKE